ncbi:30S ribosomal protein S4e [Candidatus Woesearchaeota archaeon]|nr:30S ribosomal protein S4e [Candidatus Woesearchaeota archaeon]
MGSVVEKHLSRLNSPKRWDIKKKGIKWVTRPMPGAYPIEEGISLNVAVRDIIGYAKTAKEVRKILDKGDLLVNQKEIKEPKHIIGLMDVVSFPKIKEDFRLFSDKKGKIILKKIDSKDAKTKICSIKGKTMIKKGNVQLNLNDGRNVLTEDKKYNTRDSIILEMPSNKIKGHLKFEKGALVYLTAGNHVGEIGTIDSVKENILIYKYGKDLHETSINYALVVDKDTEKTLSKK